MLAALLLVALAASPISSDKGKCEVIGVTGIVPGQDLIVHIIALVPAGSNRSDIAKQVLANQGARAMTSEEFSTTGLLWDQFFDAANTIPSVIQNYNPANDPLGGQGLVALNASQGTWNSVETSSFVFERGDETIKRCPSLVKECPGRQKFDGKNDVAWMPINGCCTLGVTWSGTSIDEADMALNTNFNWTADASGYNAQTVFSHENGHVVGLGHSNEIGSVMEAVYKGQRTELTQDDFDGITSLYPGGPTNYEPTVSITSLDNGATFASGETIGFAGNAADTVDGDLTGGLAWSSDLVGPIGTGESFSAVLSDGNHTITASVTDSGGKTGSASVTITVGPLPDSATEVGVTSITYATSGGKGGDKDLVITLTVVDDMSKPVGGASVSIELFRNVSFLASGTGITNADGALSFRLRNAASGGYKTTVTGVTADLLTWDTVTPPNEYTK